MKVDDGLLHVDFERGFVSPTRREQIYLHGKGLIAGAVGLLNVGSLQLLDIIRSCLESRTDPLIL